MCYVVFGVVCLVCSGVGFCLMSQNNEEMNEHCLHLIVNSYI